MASLRSGRLSDAEPDGREREDPELAATEASELGWMFVRFPEPVQAVLSRRPGCASSLSELIKSSTVAWYGLDDSVFGGRLSSDYGLEIPRVAASEEP